MSIKSRQSYYRLFSHIVIATTRFLISFLVAVLLMVIILQFWKNLQSESIPLSDFHFGTELGYFISHAVHSFFLIFMALIVSLVCTAFSLFLSFKLSRTINIGIVGRILFFSLSSIPCIFASYFFYHISVKYFQLSPTYNPLTPISKRWLYYIFPAVVLGICDGFLIELIRNSEEEINAIRREGYVRMSKLVGANLWKHIKNDFIIRTSRGFFSRVGVLISGTVVVEFIFSLPGLGSLAFGAAEDQNVIRLIFIILFSVIIVGLLNFLQRLIEVIFDPRLR
ncbi:ABC transporter permease subunit [Candidatus Poribacteria bacterium]|nr:ABC transporter permease subunit [Candidatus Poribacteria bacterium]